MSTTTLVIAVSYSIVVVLGIAIAVVVWRSTRVRGRADPEQLAHRERTWLVIVVLLLTGLLAATIWFTPYRESSAGASGQVVNVEARQFAWTISPAKVRADQEVEFRLTSTDVNHGFGVYDDRERLVAQVQVPPGKTQTLVHTFTRPGTYRVLCLEFCGVGHHVMETTFEVVR